MPLPQPRLRHTHLPHALGALRVTLGVVMLARPMLVPRPLGVDRITADRVSWLVRMLGARDFALGAGTLLAIRSGQGTGGDRAGLGSWLALSGVSDAVDALALARAVRRGHVGPVSGGLAAMSGVGAAALSALAILGPPIEDLRR